MAALLRAAPQPVIVVANKVDNPADFHVTADLNKLGLGEPLAVSASHGLGTGDLLDRVTGLLDEGMVEADRDEVPRIAILGRPNVGKSSLLNALLGSERAIVSEVAGTTRDTIDTRLEFEGREILLVDTAGIRRRAKIAGTIDYYAQLRAERAAERADVAILVCDASEGVTSEDLRIGELAMKAGCATLVVLNKWDIVEVDLDDAKARLERRLRLRPPVITLSALRGRNLQKVLPKALELADRRASRVKTSELNRIVAEAVRAPAAAVEAGPAPAPLLRGPGRGRAAADRDPGQRPDADQPRLVLLPRELAARGARARRRPPDHRLRAAPAEPRVVVIQGV